MGGQSYQEVSVEVFKEFPNIDGKTHSEIDDYFFKLYKKYPGRFHALYFNTNGLCPFSEDLDNILFDYYVAGILEYSNCGFTKKLNKEKYKKELERIAKEN